MSAPLPVPSKVAVTAIRGLIVGTTCSLALLTEDRRRRISNAQNVIQNGDRIRSAKNYRSGGAELALAIEEDAVLFDPYPARINWTEAQLQGVGRTRARKQRSGGGSHREIVERLINSHQEPPRPQRQQEPTRPVEHTMRQKEVYMRNDEAAQNAGASRARAWREKPRSMIHAQTITTPTTPTTPTTDRARNTRQNPAAATTAATTRSATGSLAFPRMEEIVELVEQCVITRDKQHLDHARLLLTQTLVSRGARGDGSELEQPLLKASALLVRTCQEMGRFDNAAVILREVLRGRELQESDYYDFRPLDLLEHGLLPGLESCTDSRVDPARLALASELYRPDFQSEPEVRTEQGFAVGRRLLNLTLACTSKVHMDSLYRRCRVHHPADYAFTQWYITRLHERGNYNRALRIFGGIYSKMSPSQASIEETGNVIVQSVTAANGAKARRVLQLLTQLSSSHFPMPSEWVTRLLEGNWQQEQDLDQTMEMYHSLRDHGEAGQGLQGLVSSPLEVYRTLFAITAKAKRPEMKKLILQEGGADVPALASDAVIIGIQAKLHATWADWATVQRDFMRMTQRQDNNPGDVARAFIPVLRIYAKYHTIAATDAFLRHYTSLVGVPICTQTATFMAKEYGAVRDMESLVAWLQYCAEAGLVVNAAFTNSILSNCCFNWKVPFRKLRLLQRKLHELGRGAFTDRNTERIMFEAAVAHSKREPVGFRLRKLNIKTPRASCLAGRCYSAKDVLMSMKERFATRHLFQAMEMYRRALQKDLNLSLQAHRLAIKITMLIHGGNVDEAYAIAGNAQKQGHNIIHLVLPIVAHQFKAIDGRMNKQDKFLAIQLILVQDLPQRGIPVSEAMYSMAAKACLVIPHTLGAIRFGILAAQTYRDPKLNDEGIATQPDNICYNLYNFEVLVQAFARMADVNMLRLIVDRAKKHTYWTDPFVRHALKYAKRDLYEKPAIPRVVESREIIALALRETAEEREELVKEGGVVKRDLFEIMQRAAKARCAGRVEAGSDTAAATHGDGLSAFDEMERAISEAAV